MKTKKEVFYVITGGPGVGKTSLVNELNSFGFQTVPEAARRIIKTQIQANGEGLPWKNKELYAKLMLEASMKSYGFSHGDNYPAYDGSTYKVGTGMGSWSVGAYYESDSERQKCQFNTSATGAIAVLTVTLK